ncbi:hypothetical protein [Streptomyces sp. AC550_RSS872]|uniref:hypothetical protein n=1 Tax=Streptomyces sp. AC550_RSS872 TaxID=2823689 RepID=UPI0027E4FF95|nr:hypothetical protein [Streptomyces sp. AC550_RSS872]
MKVGSGWNRYNSLRGHGDFTGDGRTDRTARSATGGCIYLFKGTGKSGTGEGWADFLARDTGGTLSLYPGTGKATSEIFSTPKSVGTDYEQYDTLG